jgi:hypothetical protein
MENLYPCLKCASQLPWRLAPGQWRSRPGPDRRGPRRCPARPSGACALGRLLRRQSRRDLRDHGRQPIQHWWLRGAPDDWLRAVSLEDQSKDRGGVLNPAGARPHPAAARPVGAVQAQQPCRQVATTEAGPAARPHLQHHRHAGQREAQAELNQALPPAAGLPAYPGPQPGRAPLPVRGRCQLPRTGSQLVEGQHPGRQGLGQALGRSLLAAQQARPRTLPK